MSRLRLFLDSNVLTSGIVSQWGLDKAVLSLCAAGICRLILAEAVRLEVEENILTHATGHPEKIGQAILGDYERFIDLAAPDRIPIPEPKLVAANRHLIRHQADVPILLSAMAARPDWVLTRNVKHFTAAVAKRTGLRIGAPGDFFRVLTSSLEA
jgi:hypothetical protein